MLGASNYTYAEATLTQRLPDFLASHTRALGYFDGVPTLVIPDQLRTGVSDPCRLRPASVVEASIAQRAEAAQPEIVPGWPDKVTSCRCSVRSSRPRSFGD